MESIVGMDEECSGTKRNVLQENRTRNFSLQVCKKKIHH